MKNTFTFVKNKLLTIFQSVKFIVYPFTIYLLTVTLLRNIYILDKSLYDIISRFFDDIFFKIVSFFLYVYNFFLNIYNGQFMDNFSKFLEDFLFSIWLDNIFKPNSFESLIIHYQDMLTNQNFLQTLPSFFSLLFVKILPVSIDIYIIFWILFLSIFVCLGRWTYDSSNRIYSYILKIAKFCTFFYLTAIFFEYIMFCLDFQVGLLFSSSKLDSHFGQFDNWIFITKFLLGFLFLLYLFILGDFIVFSRCTWSYEALIFFLVAFELMYMLLGGYNLLTIFATISALSIVSYILIAFDRTYTSIESSTKYFSVGAIGSGFMSLGYLLVYKSDLDTKSPTILFDNNSVVDYVSDISFLQNNCTTLFNSWLNESISQLSLDNNMWLPVIQTNHDLYKIGFLFFLLGFLFKLSLFPGYIWAPDVYEGSPTIVVGLLVILIKFTVLLSLVKVLFSYPQLWQFFFNFLSVVSLISIFIGSIGALTQQSIKRFIAFTSINQVGFIVLGILYDPLELLGFFSTLLVYITSNLILFAILLTTRDKQNNKLLEYMSDLHNLFLSSPKLLIFMSVAILSMAGIPPFLGFFAKYFILIWLVNSSVSIAIPAFILVMHVVSTFNYLRIIRNLWFYDMSKNIIFYSYLSKKNKYLLISLCLFQLLPSLNIDIIISFCYYWRWCLYTVGWC